MLNKQKNNGAQRPHNALIFNLIYVSIHLIVH